jgi:uncharacterized protein (TIGR02444 family)
VTTGTREALWPFALETYGRPGVEPLLLELQDDHGQCAPLLLWALWMSARGAGVDEAAAARATALARAWHDAAIAPLRDLRRRLKTPASAGSPARQARLRSGVQALELEAERMLLEMLEEASQAVSGDVDPRACLAIAARAWGAAAPAASLERLAELAL